VLSRSDHVPFQADCQHGIATRALADLALTTQENEMSEWVQARWLWVRSGANDILRSQV